MSGPMTWKLAKNSGNAVGRHNAPAPRQSQWRMSLSLEVGIVALIWVHFRINGKGNIEESDNVIWTLRRDTPDIASPILSENRLYFHKGKTGAISCVDVKTGKSFFPATRVPGLSSIYASPVAAGGHIYLSDRRGNTVVIKDNEKFEVVATNSLGETIDATPAPVDNQLIIRGERHLFCIE